MLPAVSNNATEVFGILAGLDGTPDGWNGVVYSDSLVAIRTVRDCLTAKKPAVWLPADVWGRMLAARRRAGDLMFVLLGGHPTRAELAAGVRRDGLPCSGHNVHCDKLCKTEAALIV